ncbi:MAG: hypothetical protein D6832_07535 [Alphaproteobacteria bacterium]|nr:MAG: hypothetical protein D6832_07535 [Alphaproteobacteria bacterium]
MRCASASARITGTSRLSAVTTRQLHSISPMTRVTEQIAPIQLTTTVTRPARGSGSGLPRRPSGVTGSCIDLPLCARLAPRTARAACAGPILDGFSPVSRPP